MVPDDSTLGNVALEVPETMDEGIPRARARDIESYLILQAQDKHKYSPSVINVGSSQSLK